MKKMFLALCVLMGLMSQAQIKVRDLNFSWDYTNIHTGTFNQTSKRGFAAGFEKNLNKAFSIESYYNFEANGYSPYMYRIGAGAGGWNHKYDHTYQDLYVGIRCYPLDNYHSQALALRNKEPYGFYFAYGYRASKYSRYEFALDETWGPTYDDMGNPVMNDDGSVRQSLQTVQFDQFGFTLTQWGVNFGCGWKQYHSKFVYTDIGVYSDVFSRENRYTTDYYIKDQDFADPIVPEIHWEHFVEGVQSFAKNGQGFEIRTMIGINLDFRK